MTPDQRFKWLVRLALGLFVLMFGYFVVADTYMPMTPEARVMRPVVRIAPEVSGPVAVSTCPTMSTSRLAMCCFAWTPRRSSWRWSRRS